MRVTTECPYCCATLVIDLGEVYIDDNAPVCDIDTYTCGACNTDLQLGLVLEVDLS